MEKQPFRNINTVAVDETCPACEGKGKVQEHVTCSHCKGTAKEPGYHFRCSKCVGQGTVMELAACSLCWGTGKISIQNRHYQRIFGTTTTANSAGTKVNPFK